MQDLLALSFETHNTRVRRENMVFKSLCVLAVCLFGSVGVCMCLFV